jgi:enoyl-CoA hydratase/carnithine racemase
MAVVWRWRSAATFCTPADQARFALPEVTLGIMPGMGGTQNLPRALGERTSQRVDVDRSPLQRSPSLGVGSGQPSDQLLIRCWPWPWRPRSAIADQRTVVGADKSKNPSVTAVKWNCAPAYRFEVEAYNRLVDTDDRREGVAAFNEKRPAVFKGR